MNDTADDHIVGDPGGIEIQSGDEGAGGYDYVLVGPDRGGFGFDANEIPELRSMLKRMQGDG